jgi:hypothetical protein
LDHPMVINLSIGECLRREESQSRSNNWNILSEHEPSAISDAPCNCESWTFPPCVSPLLLRPSRCHHHMIHPPRSRPPCTNIPSAICHMPWSHLPSF